MQHFGLTVFAQPGETEPVLSPDIFRASFPTRPGRSGAVLKPGDSAMRDAKTQTLTQDAQRIAAVAGSVVLLVVVLLITTHGGAAAPV